MNRRALVRWGVPAVLIVLILAVAASRLTTNGFSAPGEEPGDARIVDPVTIERIDVLLLESFPVQVQVNVEGYLPDPCYEAQEPVVEQDGNRFIIEIVGERAEDEVCAQVIQPYEQSINLGSVEPGDYAVEVNGVVQEFRVD
jgi:inhibitor of cysteine peptidase